MCWSPEVSLTFFTIEALALLYLFLRNSYFDRSNAIFHIPYAIQEGIQWLLWYHIEPNSDITYVLEEKDAGIARELR